MDGVIDSFSKGVTGLLNLSPNLFKDKESQVNLQILAPDLISFFLETFKRGGKVAKSKYREPGGEVLTLVVPQDFNLITKSESKSGGGRQTSKSRRNGGQGQSNIRHRSAIFRRFIKCLAKTNRKTDTLANRENIPSAQEVLKSPEYQKCEKKRDVQCEIIFLEFKMNFHDSSKMLVFKINKNVVEKEPKGFGGADIGVASIEQIKM